MTVSRGVFSKGLGLGELNGSLIALAVSIPVLIVSGVMLLKKQEA
jgi:ribosome-dependent ATPase